MAIKSRYQQTLDQRNNMNVRQPGVSNEYGNTVYSRAKPKKATATPAPQKPSKSRTAAPKTSKVPQAKPQSGGPSKRPTRAGAAKNKAVANDTMKALGKTSGFQKAPTVTSTPIARGPSPTQSRGPVTTPEKQSLFSKIKNWGPKFPKDLGPKAPWFNKK
jgi:hypothetical protein